MQRTYAAPTLVAIDNVRPYTRRTSPQKWSKRSLHALVLWDQGQVVPARWEKSVVERELAPDSISQIELANYGAN